MWNFNDDHLSLFIEKSKTDQFRRVVGYSLLSWILRMSGQNLRKYLSLAKLDTNDDGFLFVNLHTVRVQSHTKFEVQENVIHPSP